MTSPNRSAFKDMVLNTMIDPEKLIRRAAANVPLTLPRSLQPSAASNCPKMSGLESSKKSLTTSKTRTPQSRRSPS